MMLTPATVAKDYLQKDLRAHEAALVSISNPGKKSIFDDVHSQRTDKPAPKVSVILHDACYGHRYSRPRTSKASLNTIVERPERIHASVLGISTAYVLLGDRHSGEEDGIHPSLTAKVPPFTIHKTSRNVSLTSPVVTNVHGSKWMAELKVMCEGAEARLATNGKELVRPIDKSDDHDQEDRPKLHDGDLYLCSESLNALEGALGGVLDGVDAVFSAAGSRRSFVCIRPPGHHCSDNYPSGFCWLNNVHVGISHAAMVHGLTHAAIIDFDLHHGDGSQSITWDRNTKVITLPKNASMSKKTAIGYFSLHDINSYPCEYGDEEKVRNASLCIEDAHGQSIWNIHLQSWKSEPEFWNLYETRYTTLLEKTRAFLKRTSEKLRAHPNIASPRAAIFVSAGFDASEWESHGMQRHKVNVPTGFYARFTQDIVALSDEEGLGVDGRVISVLEGGYSDRALTSGVLSHLCGLTTSSKNPTQNQGRDPAINGLGQEMSLRLGNLGLEGEGRQRKNSRAVRSYDPQWWSHTRLEELENLVNPPLPTTGPKKSRGPANPTYSTPTQSFAAKVVPQAVGRRSLSSSLTSPYSSSSVVTKAPTPPPPEVDWATASHELMKLLVPKDRQTRSCKPEDLNAEATRARKIRQSGVSVAAEAPLENGKRMQLRDRKSRTPTYKTDEELESGQLPRVDENRRRTIGGVENLGKVLANPDSGAPKVKPPTRRRVSVASTILSAGEDVPSVPTARRPEALVVSKSRSPSKSRVARKVSAQPPVPRIPSSFRRTTSASSAQPKSRERQSSRETIATARAASASQHDMDNLSKGMKKMNIKLKVPPKEEQEVREAKRKTALKPPRKAAVPKAPKKPTEPPTKPVSDPILQPPADGIKLGPVETEEYQPTEVSFIPASISQEPFAQPTITHHDDYLPPYFMPPGSGTIPAPVVESSFPEPASSLITDSTPVAESKNNIQPTNLREAPAEQDHQPSNPADPIRPSTPQRTKESLPVFTSTSPIIFGPSSNVANMAHVLPRTDENIKTEGGEEEAGKGKEEKEDAEVRRGEDIWDVPETP